MAIKGKYNLNIFIALLATYTVLFAVTWMFLKNWLGDNVMPYYYEIMDSYEWATVCSIMISSMMGLCIVFDIIAILYAHKYRKPNVAWRNWMIIFTIISFIVPIVLACVYPLDGEILMYFLVWLFCLIASSVAFFVITYFAPYQLGFNPFKK